MSDCTRGSHSKLRDLRDVIKASAMAFQIVDETLGAQDNPLEPKLSGILSRILQSFDDSNNAPLSPHLSQTLFLHSQVEGYRINLVHLSHWISLSFSNYILRRRNMQRWSDQEASQKGYLTDRHSNRPSLRNQKLLDYPEIPNWQQDNEYIISGYRWRWRPVSCESIAHSQLDRQRTLALDWCCDLRRPTSLFLSTHFQTSATRPNRRYVRHVDILVCGRNLFFVLLSVRLLHYTKVMSPHTNNNASTLYGTAVRDPRTSAINLTTSAL